MKNSKSNYIRVMEQESDIKNIRIFNLMINGVSLEVLANRITNEIISNSTLKGELVEKLRCLISTNDFITNKIIILEDNYCYPKASLEERRFSGLDYNPEIDY